MRERERERDREREREEKERLRAKGHSKDIFGALRERKRGKLSGKACF